MQCPNQWLEQANEYPVNFFIVIIILLNSRWMNSMSIDKFHTDVNLSSNGAFINLWCKNKSVVNGQFFAYLSKTIPISIILVASTNIWYKEGNHSLRYYGYSSNFLCKRFVKWTDLFTPHLLVLQNWVGISHRCELPTNMKGTGLAGPLQSKRARHATQRFMTWLKIFSNGTNKWWFGLMSGDSIEPCTGLCQRRSYPYYEKSVKNWSLFLDRKYSHG